MEQYYKIDNLHILVGMWRIYRVKNEDKENKGGV